MKKFRYFFFAVAAVLTTALSLFSCKPEPIDPPEPPVTTDPVVIDVTDITDASCQVAVTSQDAEQLYLGAYLPYDNIEELGGMDALAEAFMEQINQLCGMYQITIDEYIAQAAEQGSHSFELTGLEASTKYLVFVFGVSEDGEITTPTYSKDFTTKDLQRQDIDFKISISDLTCNSATVTVTPSNDGLYYFDIMSEDELADFGSPEGLVTAMINYYVSNGISPADVAAQIASSGEDSYTFKLSPGTKYIAFAVGINDNFVVNSDAKQEVFTSPEIETTNLTFEFKAEDITALSGSFTITPSDNNAVYMWFLTDQAQADQFGDDFSLSSAVINTVNNPERPELVDEYKVTGEKTFDISWFSPNTDYILMAFGYDEVNGIPNTNLFKYQFTTSDITGNPCEVEMSIDIADDYSSVTFNTSEAVYYFWGSMPKDQYDDMIGMGLNPLRIWEQELKETCEFFTMFGYTEQQACQLLCDVSSATYDMFDIAVEPGVESVVYAYAVDIKEISAACDTYAISEAFTIPGESAVGKKAPSIQTKYSSRMNEAKKKAASASMKLKKAEHQFRPLR